MPNLQAGGGCARGGHSTGIKRAILTRATLAAFLTNVSLGVLSQAMPAAAQVRAEAITFDIPSQPINEALLTYARQAGVRFVMPDAQFGEVRSNAVRGAYDRETALAELLRGTGVSARLENGAIVLQRSADASRAIQGSTPAAGEGAFQSAEVTHSSTDAGGNDGADRVTVVGTNIRGVHPSSSPVETFTAEDIARSGATTTEQFIQKLPQNLSSRSLYASGSIGAGVNEESISSVDLRGLGVGTTLVLMNGRRLGLADLGRAADISMIPASAIERIEVLTDGASAIYGSDAVGGVVNFVLRDDFDGAETRVSYGGVTSGGLRQGDFTQTYGRSWGSGHGLISYSAFSASALEITDRPYANQGTERGALTPVDQRQNLLATFSQDFSDRFTISGDVALAARNLKKDTGTPNTVGTPINRSVTTRYTETDQAFANLGLDYDFSRKMRGTFRATYADTDQQIRRHRVFYNRTPPTTDFPASREKNYSALDLTAMLDGTVFALAGGDVRFSFGGGMFDEEYSGANQLGAGDVTGTLGRRTSYAFGELFLPIFNGAQRVPLIHRLELNLAARYTRYDDQSSPGLDQEFGDGTDPKVGLLWAPIAPLSFRGTYGTSFRAPSLVELDDASSLVFLDNFTPVPFPTGPNATMITIAGRPAGDLQPETATTYTMGFDFQPQSHPRLRLSGTYYSISYEDRIGVAPAAGLATIQTPELFPFVIYRPPSAAFIEDALRRANIITNLLIPPPNLNLTDPASAALALFNAQNPWVFDQTTRNLALSEQDGFDLSFGNGFDTDWGEMRYGASVTRILSYRQQAAPSELVVSVVDVATQPVDLRGRAFVGLSSGAFDGTLSVNYVDDYHNNSASSAGAAPIDSWTTTDLNLSYYFGEESGGLLNGLRLSISAQNIFDEDPPFVAGGTVLALSSPVGFDPANANPLGRIVVVGLSKKW